MELIFSESITQRQIDEFLRLGGQIAYIYQAISYGWNGRFPSKDVRLLPAALGATLVQVEAVQRFRPYMDIAGQTGRIRPIWKAGFAGSQTGFSGDPGTTIAFIGDGVDGTHVDLKGRNVYWKDFSEDDEPAPVDFDLYLYSTVPSDTGTPVLLASSTLTDKGADESLQYAPTANLPALLVVKRISGTGTFSLRSTQAGPPTAVDAQVSCAFNASTTITLKATDDGKPNPPGAVSYTILSKAAHGGLELPNGTAITTVPMKLPADKVVYKPTTSYLGQDSFTFRADDGGTAPFGGTSNTATVKIAVVKEVTVDVQVNGSTDDVICMRESTSQTLTTTWLGVGLYLAGMRFNGVTIPAGATVNRASLKICAHPYGLRAVFDGRIKGEAIDDAATSGANSRAITKLTTTTASTAWNWSEDQPWSANEWYESPDISAIVQEIVNRPGWAFNNSLVILYMSDQVTSENRMFWSFDGDSAKAAKLVITYRPK